MVFLASEWHNHVRWRLKYPPPWEKDGQNFPEVIPSPINEPEIETLKIVSPKITEGCCKQGYRKGDYKDLDVIPMNDRIN